MQIEKVIFLDIDGVLALTYNDKIPKSELLCETVYPFDKHCVEALNEIIQRTDAEIVLTSQWRSSYSTDEINEIFEWNKVIKKPIAKTNILSEAFRCAEIAHFLKAHQVNRFVIIDDVNLKCFPNNFVKTPMESGLCFELVEKIVAILNE